MVDFAAITKLTGVTYDVDALDAAFKARIAVDA